MFLSGVLCSVSTRCTSASDPAIDETTSNVGLDVGDRLGFFGIGARLGCLGVGEILDCGRDGTRVSPGGTNPFAIFCVQPVNEKHVYPSPRELHSESSPEGQANGQSHPAWKYSVPQKESSVMLFRGSGSNNTEGDRVIFAIAGAAVCF